MFYLLERSWTEQTQIKPLLKTQLRTHQSYDIVTLLVFEGES